jgi:hypothetical protein
VGRTPSGKLPNLQRRFKGEGEGGTDSPVGDFC